MTRFERATWRGPVPNQGGSMGPILGLVLHIQEGSEAGTDAWFHNPTSKVSAHFGNPKSGGLDQWVEVGTVAWAEVNGNYNWVSVENEGHSGDALTASQLENAAQLLAWLHVQYGVPLVISDTPAAGTPGLTGHGLGGSAWGGHTDCPGAPILGQRAAIIARAQQLLGATTSAGDDMQLTDQVTIPPAALAAFPDYGFNSTTIDVGAALGWGAARTSHIANQTGRIENKLDQLLSRPAPTADQIGTAVAAHLSGGGGASAADIATAVEHLFAQKLSA